MVIWSEELWQLQLRRAIVTAFIFFHGPNLSLRTTTAATAASSATTSSTSAHTATTPTISSSTMISTLVHPASTASVRLVLSLLLLDYVDNLIRNP
jgi:hypothetical protein